MLNYYGDLDGVLDNSSDILGDLLVAFQIILTDVLSYFSIIPNHPNDILHTQKVIPMKILNHW